MSEIQTNYVYSKTWDSNFDLVNITQGNPNREKVTKITSVSSTPWVKPTHNRAALGKFNVLLHDVNEMELNSIEEHQEVSETLDTSY